MRLLKEKKPMRKQKVMKIMGLVVIELVWLNNVINV